MLFAAQKAEFLKRDTSALVGAFGRVSVHWQIGSWLSKRSRYRERCIQQLTADFTPGSRVSHKHLSEYIAASAVIHNFDGWSYLGRAVGSLLMGDQDSARHLAYYAELRAAMAVLASEGIGVFDKEHVVVSLGGKCLQMPPYRSASKPGRPNGPGTHGFVWDALQELMNSTASSAIILDITSAGGSRLSEWLSHFSSAPALATKLASEWLLAWGLDIGRLAKDRNARNLSSYRPTSFTTPRIIETEAILTFVSGLWLLCEPTTENSFAVLDRLLLRALLQSAFKAAHGRSAKQAKKPYRLRIDSVLAGLQPKPVSGLDWRAFLMESPVDALSVLTQASGAVTPKSRFHSLQVISRAFLLLRLASGASSRLIKQLSGDSSSNLGFWIDAVGEDRGLWSPGSRPSPLLDLWSDTRLAIDEISPNLATIDSLSTLWKTFPNAAGTLSSCERVALWGLSI